MKGKYLIFQLCLTMITPLSFTQAQESSTPTAAERDLINEEYSPLFSSLKILPPDDMTVTYDTYKVLWRSLQDKAPWKENQIHAGQMTRLDLIPGKYEMKMEFFSAGKQVASSDTGKCAKMERTFDLKSGDQEVEIPVCTSSGEFGASENHLADARSAAVQVDAHKALNHQKPLEPSNVTTNALSVLLFGDSGTGKADQYKVAQGMLDFCTRENCEFALMLGDNIYQKGATSVDDKQFITKFEKPYSGLQIPFYVSLGNHDVHSGSKGALAQIEYSHKSSWWNMPARYYQFSKGSADFFAIDSNTFSSDKKQREWLSSALAKSTASWKIVFGHHPIYSTGSHGFWDWIEGGKMKKLRESLGPILCDSGADMYLAGHDHHLEVNHASCGVVHVISGASAKIRKSYSTMQKKWKKINKYARGYKFGFAHVLLSEDSAVLKILDSKGAPLFQYDFPNR